MSTSMKWISSEAIEARASLRVLAGEMRSAFAIGTCASANVPRRTLIIDQDPLRVFGAMPAYSREHDLFITKCAAFVEKSEPEADGSESRSVEALVAAFSAQTGRLLGVLDGAAITNLKCAAITAVVTDYCASPEAHTLGLIGTGVQARQQIRGVLQARRVSEIRVYSRDPAHVRTFIDEIAPSVGRSVVLVAARSAAEAVEGADIVSTATTSVLPLFSDVALPRHVHVNCMGAHTTESRELTNDFLGASILVVEDRETAIAEAGTLHRDAIEVRELAHQDRAHLQARRTVFSSTGHALLDLLTVVHVLSAKSERSP